MSRVEGDASRQAHCDLPEGTYEREISKEGFFGPAAFFHHRHPPTGWTGFRRAAAPARLRPRQAASAGGAARGRPPPVLRNAHLPRCASGASRGAWSSSPATPTATSSCSCTRAAASSTATTVTSSFASGRLPRAAARHDVAARVRGAAGGAADRGDQRELRAARPRAARPARDLRSGDPRHAAGSTSASARSRATTPLAGAR